MPTAEQFFSYINQYPPKAQIIKDAMALYFCMMDENSPVWVKAAIAPALMYVISPLKLIPRFIPFICNAEVTIVITQVKATAGETLTEKHHRQASEYLGW